MTIYHCEIFSAELSDKNSLVVSEVFDLEERISLYEHWGNI